MIRAASGRQKENDMTIKNKTRLRKEIMDADNSPVMRQRGVLINRTSGTVTFLTSEEVGGWFDGTVDCLLTYGDILNMIRSMWYVKNKNELSSLITWFFNDFQDAPNAYQ